GDEPKFLERFGPEATELPGEDRAEQVEDADREPTGDEEVPIGAVEAGDAEADRAHLAEHVGQAPLRIGLAEAERVADGEQQQQDRGCAICIGRLHSLSPWTNADGAVWSPGVLSARGKNQ